MEKKIRQRLTVLVLIVLCTIISTGCNSIFKMNPAEVTYGTQDGTTAASGNADAAAASEAAEEKETAAEETTAGDMEEQHFDEDMDKAAAEKYSLTGEDAFYILPSGTALPDAVRNFKIGGMSPDGTTLYYAYQILYNGQDESGLGGAGESGTRKPLQGSAEIQGNYEEHKNGLSGTKLTGAGKLVTIFMSYNHETHAYEVGYHKAEDVTVTPTTAGDQDTGSDDDESSDEEIDEETKKMVTGLSIVRAGGEKGYTLSGNTDLLSMYLHPVKEKEEQYLFYHDGMAWFTNKAVLASAVDTRERLNLLEYEFGSSNNVEASVTDCVTDENADVFLNVTVEDKTEVVPESEEREKNNKVSLILKFYELPLGTEQGRAIISVENENFRKQCGEYGSEAYIDFGERTDAPDESEIMQEIRRHGLTADDVRQSIPDIDGIYKPGEEYPGISMDLYRLDLSKMQIPEKWESSSSADALSAKIRNVWEPLRLRIGSEGLNTSSLICFRLGKFGKWEGEALNQLMYLAGSNSAEKVQEDREIVKRTIHVQWEEKVSDGDGGGSGDGGSDGSGGGSDGSGGEGGSSDGGSGGSGSDGGGGEAETEEHEMIYELPGDFLKQRYVSFGNDARLMWTAEERNTDTLLSSPMGVYRLIDRTENTDDDSKQNGKTAWIWDARTPDLKDDTRGASGTTNGSLTDGFSGGQVPGCGDSMFIETDKMLTIVTGILSRNQYGEPLATGKAMIFTADNSDLNFINSLTKYDDDKKDGGYESDEKDRPGDIKESTELSGDTKEEAANNKRGSDSYSAVQVYFPETGDPVKENYWFYLAGPASGILKVNMHLLVYDLQNTNIDKFQEHSHMDYKGIAESLPGYHMLHFGTVGCIAKGSFFGIRPDPAGTGLIAVGFQKGENTYNIMDACLAKIYRIPFADSSACENLVVSNINKDALFQPALSDQFTLTDSSGKKEVADSDKIWKLFLSNAGIKTTDDGYSSAAECYKLIRTSIKEKSTGADEITNLIGVAQKVAAQEAKAAGKTAEEPYTLSNADREYIIKSLSLESDTAMCSLFIMAYGAPWDEIKALVPQSSKAADRTTLAKELYEAMRISSSSQDNASAGTAAKTSAKTSSESEADQSSMNEMRQDKLTTAVGEWAEKCRNSKYPVGENLTLEQAEKKWSEDLNHVLTLMHSPDDVPTWTRQNAVKKFAKMAELNYTEDLYTEFKRTRYEDYKELEERMVQEKLDSLTMERYRTLEWDPTKKAEEQLPYVQAHKEYEKELQALKLNWMNVAAEWSEVRQAMVPLKNYSYSSSWDDKWQKKWVDTLNSILNDFN